MYIICRYPSYFRNMRIYHLNVLTVCIHIQSHIRDASTLPNLEFLHVMKGLKKYNIVPHIITVTDIWEDFTSENSIIVVTCGCERVKFKTQALAY